MIKLILLGIIFGWVVYLIVSHCITINDHVKFATEGLEKDDENEKDDNLLADPEYDPLKEMLNKEKEEKERIENSAKEVYTEAEKYVSAGGERGGQSNSAFLKMVKETQKIIDNR